MRCVKTLGVLCSGVLAIALLAGDPVSAQQSPESSIDIPLMAPDLVGLRPMLGSILEGFEETAITYAKTDAVRGKCTVPPQIWAPQQALHEETVKFLLDGHFVSDLDLTGWQLAGSTEVKPTLATLDAQKCAKFNALLAADAPRAIEEVAAVKKKLAELSRLLAPVPLKVEQVVEGASLIAALDQQCAVPPSLFKLIQDHAAIISSVASQSFVADSERVELWRAEGKEAGSKAAAAFSDPKDCALLVAVLTKQQSDLASDTQALQKYLGR